MKRKMQYWAHSKYLQMYYYKVEVIHFPKTLPLPEWARVAVRVDRVRQGDVLTHFSASGHIVHVPSCARGSGYAHTCTGCACMCKGVRGYACVYLRLSIPVIPRAHAYLPVPVQYPCTDSGGPPVHCYYGNKEAIPSFGKSLRCQKRELTQSSQQERQNQSMRALGCGNLSLWGLGSGTLRPSESSRKFSLL